MALLHNLSCDTSWNDFGRRVSRLNFVSYEGIQSSHNEILYTINAWTSLSLVCPLEFSSGSFADCLALPSHRLVTAVSCSFLPGWKSCARVCLALSCKCTNTQTNVSSLFIPTIWLWSARTDNFSLAFVNSWYKNAKACCTKLRSFATETLVSNCHACIVRFPHSLFKGY